MGGQGASAERESAVPDPAAGEHRRRRPRLYRAWARQAGHATEAVLHRSAIPPRAPAERTLSPVLPNWSRDHRAAQRGQRVAGARCRSAGDAGYAAGRSWPARLEFAAEFRRLRGRSRALQQGSARGVAARRAADVRRLPAPRGNQSAARARLQTPEDQPIIEKLPKISEYLDEPCREHFAAVRAMLDAVGVLYSIDERMVRGLDYYTRTTFEFTHGGLGAQSAVLGGGRYDGLSESLDGPKAPGIGFAIGEDRLILALQSQGEQPSEKVQAFPGSFGRGNEC